MYRVLLLMRSRTDEFLCLSVYKVLSWVLDVVVWSVVTRYIHYVGYLFKRSIFVFDTGKKYKYHSKVSHCLSGNLLKTFGNLGCLQKKSSNLDIHEENELLGKKNLSQLICLFCFLKFELDSFVGSVFWKSEDLYFNLKLY